MGAERLRKRAVSEEESKLLEEQIVDEQKGAGISSGAVCRPPEATPEQEEASSLTTEVDERCRAVRLVGEKLAARGAALGSAEQVQSQAVG